MAEVVLKTNKPERVSEILKEALEKEKLRIKYSLDLAVNRLKKFEQKYNIPTKTFINQWSAEDLKGGDIEYVEWAGEYEFLMRLNEQMAVLKSIEHVSP